MQYKMAVITTSHEGIEHISNLLITIGVGGFEVCDSEDFKEFLESKTPAYDYIDDNLMKLASQRTLIKFYTANNDQGVETINLVEKALMELKSSELSHILGTLELSITLVDDSNWKDNWKKYYKPMLIGDNLIVSPAWENVETDKILLKIDPGMAFGTGSHETTSLCLEFIQQQDLVDKKVLDVGCGSGILSQASVLLGAKSACGCDIDDAAVSCAVSNAKLNGIADKVTYYNGNLIEKITGKYEIVVANIVADVIMMLTNDIKTVICNNGIFISSGIIVERINEVKQHIEACGFEVLEIREKRGWAAILARLK